MSDLSDLYQEVILDHNKRPRNFRALEAANQTAEGFNPLCGDRLHLYLRVEDGVIADVGFQGSGCAISKASASLMTDSIKGRPVEEVRALFQRFHTMVTTPPDKSVEDMAPLHRRRSDRRRRLPCSARGRTVRRRVAARR